MPSSMKRFTTRSRRLLQAVKLSFRSLVQTVNFNTMPFWETWLVSTLTSFRITSGSASSASRISCFALSISAS